MKKDIENILDDAATPYEGGTDFDSEKATKELQRLFLSKQVELLDSVVRMDGNAVAQKLYEIQYEIKQLSNKSTSTE